jgi:hypothetical protein
MTSQITPPESRGDDVSESTQSTALDVNAIRERCEQASRGAWFIEGPDDEADFLYCIRNDVGNGSWEVGGVHHAKDARFIVQARSDIPALLARVEALESQLQEARNTIRFANETLRLLNESDVALREVEDGIAALTPDTDKAFVATPSSPTSLTDVGQK